MTEHANPRYCPTDWLDEINPLADTPEAFIRRDGTQWLLIDPDEESEAETSSKSSIEPGQIINFGRLTNYNDFILTVRDDGSYHADAPEFDGHPGFRLEDWEWEDSVDELSEVVRLGISGDTFADVTNPLPAGTYTIECWAWRDTIPYRFELDGETPKFTLCAGAN